MATFKKYDARCKCGAHLVVNLAHSVNAKRNPSLRDAIVRGTLNSAQCPNCSRTTTFERSFTYTDFARGSLFRVEPRSQRHTWQAVSETVSRAAARIPSVLLPDGNAQLRVIFGLDELREKLVAQDADLDDRLIELIKVFLIYDHPFLLSRPRLRLTLDRVSHDALEFTAAYEHSLERFRLTFPRTIATDLASREDELRSWVREAHGEEDLFSARDHWVNLWRWSPQPSALSQLRKIAQAIRDGEQVDTRSAAFTRMLRDLPRGAHLPAWAKKDLRSIEDYVRRHDPGTLEDQLFEIRFAFGLADDWATNDKPNDIATLWQLLDDLPDGNVEGNTMIHQITLVKDDGGGSYDPKTHDIEIGDEELDVDEDRFESLVRHEVGHAVHEMLYERVNDWLASTFGWRTFGTDDQEIDSWVQLMGGWGNLTGPQRATVRGYLRVALGDGEAWAPGPSPNPPPNDPWLKDGFGPRLASEMTGADWYTHFDTWYSSSGKAFFLNYWYRTFVAVDLATLDLIRRMPSSYAAMSHFEFFAELYALYHDDDDPRRAAIPDAVAQWINANVSSTSLRTIQPALPRRKDDWETTSRPRGGTERLT